MIDLPKNLDGTLGTVGLELGCSSFFIFSFYKDTLKNVLHIFTEILTTLKMWKWTIYICLKSVNSFLLILEANKVCLDLSLFPQQLKPP